MLEQNTELGSMKKTSFYLYLLLACPYDLFFSVSCFSGMTNTKEKKINMRNDMYKQAEESTGKYIGILIFTAILCWRIQYFLILV